MSERYSFIDAQRDTRNTDGSLRYTVKLMCAWLAVSTSGFYEWATRPTSPSARWRAELGDVIEAIFAEFDGTYGYRRIHA
ncbi:MAG: transposase, partial [Microthrixaceae bacterium]|nr:transposase [Microthrixaceae bacterium]